MANLDTFQKRFSGIHVGSPWRGANVVPTGTVIQAERQASAHMYSGILAAPLTPVVPSERYISVSHKIGIGLSSFLMIVRCRYAGSV